METTWLAERVRMRSRPLKGAEDLDPLFERIGDARCVLLGEASHGTSEYYSWRAKISERLIREKGFSFIAVEGDWPYCYEVNRYVKGYPDWVGPSLREIRVGGHPVRYEVAGEGEPVVLEHGLSAFVGKLQTLPG